LGDWAKTSQAKKMELGKGDRFSEKELPETLSNAIGTYRGTGRPGEWRYDIMVTHAVMPDGQERFVYSRVNRFGQEEITGWHNWDKVKYPDFLEKFKSQPPLENNRTDFLKKNTS